MQKRARVSEIFINIEPLCGLIDFISNLDKHQAVTMPSNNVLELNGTKVLLVQLIYSDLTLVTVELDSNLFNEV